MIREGDKYEGFFVSSEMVDDGRDFNKYMDKQLSKFLFGTDPRGTVTMTCASDLHDECNGRALSDAWDDKAFMAHKTEADIAKSCICTCHGRKIEVKFEFDHQPSFLGL